MEQEEGSTGLIVENQVVLLCKHGIYKAVELQKGKKVNFDKLSFFADAAIGLPFGTNFELRGKHLVRVQFSSAQELHPARADKQSDEDKEDKEDEGQGKMDGRDNRAIVDDGLSQKLTHEEIQEMKKKGVSGQVVLESVVANSSSFSERTKFSQEKYLKKKEKTHLRYDTIAQMLTLGNVRAHSNMIVMETCQGLLLGSVLERMGGHGNLVHIFFGDLPVKTALDNFSHLSHEVTSILTHYPLDRVASLESPSTSTVDDVVKSTSVIADHPQQPFSDVCRNDAELSDVSETDSEVEDECQVAKRRKLSLSEDKIQEKSPNLVNEGRHLRRREREIVYHRAAEILKTKSMDGLLVASRFHPEPIVMSLIQFVAPSRPIVIYSQFKETLVQCYQKLRQSGNVFNLNLTETWTRLYQVLPGRTHPQVQMDAQGGYLLFGTTTLKKEEQQQQCK